MRVEVIEEDIDLGCRTYTLNCPIARAVSRASGLYGMVSFNYIYVLSRKPETLKDESWRELIVKKWATPDVIAGIIMIYDYDGGMSPFCFEL